MHKTGFCLQNNGHAVPLWNLSRVIIMNQENYVLLWNIGWGATAAAACMPETQDEIMQQ